MPAAKILIVEDEAIIARDIKQSVERLGYTAAAITDNGLDAINLAKQLQPDLVIMDIYLKGPMDGIDAALRINGLVKVPIVFLTAHQTEEILERSKAARPYGYLLKPLNERDLNSCLRMALYRFDTERKLKESEERYFRLADNARDMIFRMSLVTGIYEYINKACFYVTGYSRNEFYNNPMYITKIVHPDWLEYFNNEWEKLKKGEASPVHEFQIINKHGETRWLNQRNVVISNEFGIPEAVEGVVTDVTNQKQFELALKQSESKYRNLTKNAPVAFTRLIVGENRYEIVNDEFEKQSGYTLDEFNNLSEEEYQQLIHHEDREAVMSEYKQWVQSGSGGVKNLIYRIINKSGEILWLDSYHYADHGSDGKPAAINQLYFNINQRIESENVLRESKQYLDAFFSQSLDGIFIAKTSRPVEWSSNIDKDETLDFIFGDIKLTKVNKPICDQFGMTEEQALKVHPLEYYKGNMGPVRERWRKFLDEGYLHINEYFKKQHGEDIYIEGDYYCLYDSKKQFIGYLGIQRDMTERKVAEENIRLSEEKFRAVAEAIPAQVVIFQDENFVYINPYSEIITGYKPEELFNMNFWDIVHPDYAETARQRGIARQKGEEVPDNYEMKIITRQGEEKWINYSARIINFNGKPAVLGTSTDITVQKNAGEEVERSLREKEILLKEIHHRVKNNLQIVTSLLKLQSSYVKDEKVKRLFKESQNRVQSMSLIHQKLYQTKDLSHIDFKDYIETVVTHLQHSFGILEDRVNVVIEVKDITMSIDNAIPAGLIINELVSNSLKHAFPSNKKGKIYINLSFDDASRDYKLIIRDSGVGMPADIDINKTDSFGLKLVSTLVNQMSGSIEVTQDKGCSYEIVFKSALYKERN